MLDHILVDNGMKFDCMWVQENAKKNTHTYRNKLYNAKYRDQLMQT